MLNVEVKVRVDDLDPVRARAESLGARREGVLTQTDTYFQATHGRLKLREFAGQGAELIAYTRPDEQGGRVSDYLVVPVARPSEMKDALRRSLGVRAVVVKKRELWLLARTRIHLDEVSGLGSFVELETVAGDRGLAAARAEFNDVAAALQLDVAGAIGGSYAELAESTRGNNA